MRRLLTGLEAVARGAIEGGVHLVAGCPGLHTAEVLAACAADPDLRTERTSSEEEALGVARGAAAGGAQALAVLGPGGLEAAAGALAAASRGGSAGLLVVVSDDPAGRLAPSSDSRLTARAAMLPVLEPSDPTECRAFVEAGLELSARFDTPVVLRLTSLLADSAGPVEVAPRRAEAPRGWRWNRPAGDARWLGTAPRARGLERMALLAAHAWDTPLNRMELRSADIGVVASGAAYGLVREALPEASLLKLGLSQPVPTSLVREFAARVKRLCVAEELEPVVESELRAAGIACEGRNRLSRAGALCTASIARAFGSAPAQAPRPEAVPERPDEACPGCPHRALVAAVKRLHVAVTTDLACADLARLSPALAVDRSAPPGGAVAEAHGLEAVLGSRIAGRSLALCDVRSLLRSGAGAVALAAGSAGKLVVFDAAPLREGCQVEAPGGRVDLCSLLSALGARSVRSVDPLNLHATVEALRQELHKGRSSAVVARSPCVRQRRNRPPRRVDPVRCNRCGACLRLGCPAIAEGGDGEAMAIEAASCAGCGLCAQVCRPGAIGLGPAGSRA